MTTLRQSGVEASVSVALHRTQIKIRCVSKVFEKASVPTDLLSTVLDYAFYSTIEYRARVSKQRAMSTIRQCLSRKNGFWQQEPDDTEDEHWAFGLFDDNLNLQAISCSRCGHYVYSRCSLPLPARCQCDLLP